MKCKDKFSGHRSKIKEKTKACINVQVTIHTCQHEQMYGLKNEKVYTCVHIMFANIKINDFIISISSIDYIDGKCRCTD